MDTRTEHIQFENVDAARYMYGQRDEHLRSIERSLEVSIGARGGSASISGAPADVTMAVNLLEQLYELANKGAAIDLERVSRAIAVLSRDADADLTGMFADTAYVTVRNKTIAPKTLNQKRYLDTIRRHDLTFGLGPAGTGKTFLAVAMAMAALRDKQVQKVILTRPAVEAGERLGFLPGDLSEKVNPYLRPLLDAISEMVDAEKAQKMVERGTIEIAPLAFMRGRTLSDAFIILDEAQNTTREQMKMFLTRLGFNSRTVVTGDSTQIDLMRKRDSGLLEAQRILGGVEGIGFTHFDSSDVVRHDLVQRIIEAYERGAASNEAG